VAWDGQGWAVVWSGRLAEGIYLRRLTTEGTRHRGGEARIHLSGGPGLPDSLSGWLQGDS
jgi:hypothetical protein